MAVEQPTNPYIQEIHKEHLEIRQRIGRGSFGEVYQAYDNYRHHICAVKILIGPPEFTASEKNNLKAEADKMCRVRDDNVISFFGLCIDAGRGICGLVMPYMPYGSLQQLLRQTTAALPWALRIRILYQTARGMNALHLLEPKLLHMDLKPGNILLTDSLEVCVADFGLSRLKKQTSQSHTATRLTGTWTHIPPEHLDDMNLVPTTKFDVYSYGITVWEVLTRQGPYINAVNAEQIIMCVVNGQRPDLTAIPQNVEPQYEISTSIQTLMCLCWAQDPTERPGFSNVVSSMKRLEEQFSREAQECISQFTKGMTFSSTLFLNSQTVRTLDDVIVMSKDEALSEEQSGIAASTHGPSNLTGSPGLVEALDDVIVVSREDHSSEPHPGAGLSPARSNSTGMPANPDSFRQLQNVVPYTVDHPILVDLASFTSLDLHVNARGISDTQIMLEWEHDHGDHEHDHRNYQYKIRYRPHNGQGYAPLPLVNPYKKKHVEDGNIIILKKLQAGVEYEIGVVVKCLPADDQRYIACYACTLKH